MKYAYSETAWMVRVGQLVCGPMGIVVPSHQRQYHGFLPSRESLKILSRLIEEPVESLAGHSYQVRKEKEEDPNSGYLLFCLWENVPGDSPTAAQLMELDDLYADDLYTHHGDGMPQDFAWDELRKLEPVAA